jgi:hypothetical protein
MTTKRPTTKRTTIKTIWNMRTYDVWGNAKDGYDVNDSYSHGNVTLYLTPETHNVGTPQEFTSAYPSDKQLRSVFGVRCQIECDGDDQTIYVKRARDWYPIGELSLESHASLSPIREHPANDPINLTGLVGQDTDDIEREIAQYNAHDRSLM